MRRLHLTLQIAALVLAVAGLVLVVAPPATAVAPLPFSAGGAGESTRPTASQVADSLAEEIVLANIFSATRSAPPSRYTPPEVADSAAGMLSEPSAETVLAEAGFTPVLYGTMVGGDARALLQLDALATAPRLYGIGERDGGYRVVSIAPREVVLSGPRGRVVLRLPQQEERR
jgi:hypothetical protein